MQQGFPKGAVQVAAAVIREDGKILIAKRNARDHMGGLWEFPGGKREREETMEDCLRRELLEELQVRIKPERLWKTVRYSYPEKTVEIYFYHCRLVDGVLKAAGCEDFRWVRPEELRNFDFPPADAEIVNELQKIGESQ